MKKGLLFFSVCLLALTIFAGFGPARAQGSVRRATWRTSGMVRIRDSAAAPRRDDSASEIPGAALTATTAVPSLKGGRNSVPMRETAAMETSTRRMQAAITAFGRGMDTA